MSGSGAIRGEGLAAFPGHSRAYSFFRFPEGLRGREIKPKKVLHCFVFYPTKSLEGGPPWVELQM